MPDKGVMPLIVKDMAVTGWKVRGKNSTVRFNDRDGRVAMFQRDADQKWSDDRLEAKEGELNDWRRKACSALLSLNKSEAQKKEWANTISSSYNRALAGMEALPEPPADFWKGYWQGQIDVLIALKAAQEELCQEKK